MNEEELARKWKDMGNEWEVALELSNHYRSEYAKFRNQLLKEPEYKQQAAKIKELHNQLLKERRTMRGWAKMRKTKELIELQENAKKAWDAVQEKRNKVHDEIENWEKETGQIFKRWRE